MWGAALLSRLTTDAPLFLRMPGLARDPRGRVRSELFVPVLYNFIRSKRKGSGQSVSQSVIHGPTPRSPLHRPRSLSVNGLRRPRWWSSSLCLCAVALAVAPVHVSVDTSTSRCVGGELETSSATPIERHTKNRTPILRRVCQLGKFVFCLTGPYLTGQATIGRLELPPGEGRFVDPPTGSHSGSAAPVAVQGRLCRETLSLSETETIKVCLLSHRT